MPLPPTVLAMILCDDVRRDPVTGKTSYLNTFSALGAPEFPAAAPPFYVALTLTDGIGTQRVDVRLVDARGPTFHTMREGRAEIPFSDRFMAWETGFRFEDVTFPSPGEYRAQSWVGGELLMERRIVLYPSVDERRTPEES